MNGMKWSWPALKAEGVVHTVDTTGGRRAGFLVRSTSSRAELGYIWPAGNAWMWRTPDGHHGERSSQTAAVRVLRDAFDLALSGRRSPRLPFDEATAPRPSAPHSAPEHSAPALSAPQRPGPQRPGPQRPTAPRPSAPRPSAPRPSAPHSAPAPDEPEVPMKRIVWADQAPNLTNTIGALLERMKK